MGNEQGSLQATTLQLIDRAIEEDQLREDITTRYMVPDDLRAEGVIIAREAGVLAGTFVIDQLFNRLSGNIQFSSDDDGREFRQGDVVLTLEGSVETLLAGERVALNFLQHLSGVATRTSRFVRKVANQDVRILDTRKTTPGWRTLEKYAVRVGGGKNHRMNMSEMALVKENHLHALKQYPDQDLKSIVEKLQKTVEVQIEVSSLNELEFVLSCRPELILLDNMSVKETARAVDRIESADEAIRIEASGGIDLNNVKDYAETGVDRISIGSLTHSAPAVDFSMQLQFEKAPPKNNSDSS